MTREPVGTLAEEAAKLVSAISSMSSSIGSATASPAGDHEPDHDPLSPECRYCPICSAGRAARSVTPEVREHLASAALSLAAALKSFVEEAMSPPPPDESPVEKIDLAED